ncbi:DNA-directed RNA polymerase subunit beta' [Gossypium arboreum]|uniref:DNA-directed RNA polymerase subunit beta n=1 Tax=Gossypium arboreum TaxID=29729 RepID=A0A0B0P5B0_GOSAR|nr:DNA-directed RNA polymerase subunit beta' [Gossypium arboreum]
MLQWRFLIFLGFLFYVSTLADALKSLKNGALETVSSARWAAEWEEHAKPLISEVISRKTNLNFSHLVSKLAIPANCLCHICWFLVKVLNIMVNYFSAKYTNHSASCRSLPEQMKVKVCTMDELPCYTEPDEFEYKDDCDNLDEYDKVSDSCETVPETYPNADNLHSIIHGACHEQSEQIEENGKIKPGESSNLGVDMISIAGKESLRGMRFIYAVEADEDPQPWLKEKLSTTDA